MELLKYLKVKRKAHGVSESKTTLKWCLSSEALTEANKEVKLIVLHNSITLVSWIRPVFQNGTYQLKIISAREGTYNLQLINTREGTYNLQLINATPKNGSASCDWYHTILSMVNSPQARSSSILQNQQKQTQSQHRCLSNETCDAY